MAPCAGALLGTLVYELMIEVHHPHTPSELQTPQEDMPELEMKTSELDCGKPT